MYEKIKGYYDAGLWGKIQVYNVVAKNAITAEEYEIITGEVYVEPEPTEDVWDEMAVAIQEGVDSI